MNTQIIKPLVLLLSLISFGALADTPVINDLIFLSNPSELAAAMKQPNWKARAAIIGQETGLSSLNQQIGQPWFKNKVEAMREVATNDLSLLSDPIQLSAAMKQPSWPAKAAQMEKETGLSSLGWQVTQPWFKNKVSWAKITLNNAGNSSVTPVDGASKREVVRNDLSLLSDPIRLSAAMKQPSWPAKAAQMEKETGLNSLRWQITQPWFKNKVSWMKITLNSAGNSSVTPVSVASKPIAVSTFAASAALVTSEAAKPVVLPAPAVVAAQAVKVVSNPVVSPALAAAPAPAAPAAPATAATKLAACMAAPMPAPSAASGGENYLAELANPGQLAWQKTQTWWPTKLANMEQALGIPNLMWQMAQPGWTAKLAGLNIAAAQQATNAALAARKALCIAEARPKPLVPEIFSPSSFWYTPIPSTVTLNIDTAQYQAEFMRQMTSYYGDVNLNTYGGASTVFYVPANQPTVKVTLKNCGNPTGWVDPNLQAQFAAVPIPSYAVSDEGTDHEMTIYQPSTDTMWEFWIAQKVNGQWSACWGGQMQSVSTNPGYFSGHYGATATSLPFLGGQITAEELKNGVINHVIGISLQDTQNFQTVSWPAQRSDGGNPNNLPYWIPEGTRFRLDPTINIDALNLTPIGKTIAKAAQVYGFVVWDRSGGITIRLEDGLSYTANGGADPYPALFGSSVQYNALNGFPWNHLQFLPMNYGKP